jgi:hypothetical protein
MQAGEACRLPPSTRIARGGEGACLGLDSEAGRGVAAFTEAAVPADRRPTPTPPTASLGEERIRSNSIVLTAAEAEALAS